MSRLEKPLSHSRNIRQIAMLSIHSDPIDELGTRDNGGMSVYIRELAKELGKMGIFVDVFTQCQNQPASSIIPMFDNVRLVRLNLKSDQPVTKENLSDYLPAVFAEYNEIVEKEKTAYDLVHSHYWLSGVLGTQIKQMRGIAHVTTFHTLGAVKNRAYFGESEPDFRIQQEKRLAAACDRIITSTQNEKSDLISLYHAADEKIGVVPAGVNLEMFQPFDKAEARNRLGLKGNEVLMLYVGRFVPVKGLDRMLKMMPCINHGRQGKNRFRLLVVGGDGENEKQQSMIRELNIQDAVDFMGRKGHSLMPVYYNAADMLVVPSYHESFCLAGLESLACGIPVVTAPVGGMTDIVSHENGCVLVENNDRELALSIVHVANNLQQGHYSAKRIRSSVQHYSWAGTANRMLEEYHQLPANQTG